MIYSMTGYANKTLQINKIVIQLEIKSVNHRFLDISIKSAEEFKPLEINLRNIISKYISRGKIDIRLFFKDSQEINQTLTLNQNLLTEYLKLVSQIKQTAAENISCSVNQIITFPGMLIQDEYSITELEASLIEIFNNMLHEFTLCQQVEGDKLRQILQTKLDEMQGIIHQLYPLLKEVTSTYQTKLKQRLLEFLTENEINDVRFQQEFAFFCQKMDVSEEIDRLNAHVNEFSQLLTKGGHIGKRLDFICQEMHREANTFGSKSVSIESTRRSIELKVLIEQIREQVQNIM